MALFDRAWQVIIGTPANPNQASYGSVGTGSTPLRVAFNVAKGQKGSPNKAVISIFNMAPQNRAAIRQGMLVTLSAGYNAQVQTLFAGVVTKVTAARAESDIVVMLECGDGESAITTVNFDRAYDAGTTLAQVLTDVATAMQLVTAGNPTGVDAGAALGIPPITYGKGLTVHGSVRNTLDKLCKPAGLEWSVQNGALQIIPLAHHSGEAAEVIGPDTGLIDVPSTDGEVTSFVALLNPRLAPGRLVQLQSSSINGFFKIRGGKWDGDSHGPKWQAAIEAVAAPNVFEVLPAAAGFNYETGVEVV